MNTGYPKFDKLKDREKLDVYEATAERLDTTVQAIEKDVWVCRAIDAMFKGLPRQPKLYFKGGTSLSKGYGLIKRFSEDIDIVVSRNGLRIAEEDDPLNPDFNKRQREAAVQKVLKKCSLHVLGRMREQLADLMPTCTFEEDPDDADKMSLRVKYPSLVKRDEYLRPWVKIECGARGAKEPIAKLHIVPYVQQEIGTKFNLAIKDVTLISAERTFWEKILILHGIYCGFRDDNARRPGDKNLISRHYYDVAMMRESAQGLRAAKDFDLLDAVREHKQLLFRRGWEKLNEAVPGRVRLVPQPEIQADLETDFEAMSGMMFGEAPSFAWVLEELQKLEEAINKRLV